MAATILPQGNGPPARAATVLGNDPPPATSDSPEAQQDTSDYSDAELLREARDFLDYVETAEADNRTRAAECLRFTYKRFAQWPDKIYRDRTNENRPCLEINQLPQFVNQVLNDQRQNRPAIKVRPVSDDATVEIAEIHQDLIRHIEYDSNAPGAIDNAFRYAVAGNVGFWRFTTEYEDEDSFNQKICFTPIPDPFAVYYDPDCKEPDGSDCERVLVSQEMNKNEFQRLYPDASPIDWETTDPVLTAWLKPDMIRIADYLHVVKRKETLYLMHNGDRHFASEKPVDWPEELSWPPNEDWYVDKREVDRRSVRWEVINGLQVLERHEWAGKFIPIVPVYGDETNIEGDRIRKGLIDGAIDSQQMYNFLITSAAEAASNQPKAPYLVTSEQVAGHEREFGQANIKNYPYLTYNKFTEGGQEAGYGPPQRQSVDTDVQGLLAQAQVFQMNLRATIGIQDPLQNMQVQDQSGRAILAKERVSNTGTFHFQDNLSRAIAYGGRILLDLIPHIYDTQRTLQLLKEDGTQYAKQVNVPSPMPPQMGQQMGQTGPLGMPAPGGLQPNGQANPAAVPPQPVQAPPRIRDLTVGSYDVMVEAGPSYSTKRVEFANQAMELAQSYPAFWGIAGDILVKNLDMPNAEKIADRLKVMLPPPIQMLENNPDADPQVIALQSAMQQQTQQSQAQIQQLSQELQKANNSLLQTQSQLHITKAQAADAQSKANTTMATAQADIQTQRMESNDVRERIRMDREEMLAENQRKREELNANIVQERAQLSAQIKQDQAELALQTIDRITNLIALQQKQAQPVAQEAEQMTAPVQAIERQVSNGAAPAQAPDLSGITQMLGDVHQRAQMHDHLLQQLTQLHGATQGSLRDLGQMVAQTHEALGQMATRKPGKRTFTAKRDKDGSLLGESQSEDGTTRRMRLVKNKDGSISGETLDDEE